MLQFALLATFLAYSLGVEATQLELSKESYHALKAVLKGRTPVGIESAVPFIKQLNIKPKEYVVLDFHGSGYSKRPSGGQRYHGLRAGPKSPPKYSKTFRVGPQSHSYESKQLKKHQRHHQKQSHVDAIHANDGPLYKPSYNGDKFMIKYHQKDPSFKHKGPLFGKDIFRSSEGHSFAEVQSVDSKHSFGPPLQHTLHVPVFDEGRYDGPHESLDSVGFGKHGSITIVSPRAFDPLYRNEVNNIEPLSKRESTAVKKLVRRSRRQVTESEEDNPDNNFLDSFPFAFSTGGSFLERKPTPTREVVRLRRQFDDSEENPDINFLESLPFAFSSGGSLFGSSVGRYLDTMNQATFRLSNSLRTLGNLGVSQLDAFLDQQDDKRNNSSDK